MNGRVFCMVSTVDSARYTGHALSSFFEHTPFGEESEFFLIDNDHSIDQGLITACYPKVQLVQNTSPKSFAANLNSGLLKAADGMRDLYFLNNDIIFSPRWLEPLLENKHALITPACNMQFSYSTNKLIFKLSMTLSEYLGQEREFLNIVVHHQKVRRGYKLTHSVPYYCIKIPYIAYKLVGFFDEAYSPAGWEDTDYTLRCYLKGIPIYFALDSLILHFYGKSTWKKDLSVAQPETIIQPERGYEVFKEKWGEELADIFGYQKPEAIEKLVKFEQEAIVRGYGSLIRTLMHERTEIGAVAGNR